MEEMVVAMSKNGKRKWTVEQKMHILEERRSGVPLGELCRKYNIEAQRLYHWRKRLTSGGKSGLQQEGGIVARSRYIAALKRIEELEKALGRKTLELEIVKKSFELKGLKLPEGM